MSRVDIDVCAIVLNYRNAELTARCLRSFIGQGVACIRLVDNSECDRSFAELDSVLSYLRAELDCPLILSRPVRNTGFANGVNYAIQLDQQTPHAFYLLFNNDAVLLPGAVAILVNAALANPSCLLFTPKCMTYNSYSMMWYQRYTGLLFDFPIFGGVPYLSGACLLVRRTILKNGLLFDPIFFMYGEDLELSWRAIQLSGTKKALMVVPDAMYLHESGKSSSQGGWFYEFHLARCHWLTTRRLSWFEGEWLLQLPLKFIFLLLRAMFRSCRFYSIVPIKALFMSAYSVCIKK